MADEIQITVTPLANTKLREYLEEEPSDTVVRLLVEDDGKYGLSLDQQEPGDVGFAADGIRFVVEAPFAEVIEDLKIDYLDQGASSGFALTGGKPTRSAAPQQGVKRVEETPNPDARKFVLAFSLGRGAKTLTRADLSGDAEVAPALREVLGLDEVASVFVLNDFVTVTRSGPVDWSELQPRISELLGKLEKPAPGATSAAGSGAEPGTLNERLERFVETDVAPFLQQDGGDIELLGVDDGTVKVRLVGACGTCPSSVATLRFGVERRLKEAFPGEVSALELVEGAHV